jgi:peptide-methionine (S)-S-oxide reductase
MGIGWNMGSWKNVVQVGGRGMPKATFGAGCFWGVELAFRQIDGVMDATVGYAGGTKANPTYEEVCAHGTGHAEVVQVDYDPARVTYQELLDAFWKLHDPTQLNRQGPDIGDQYRSVVFFHTTEQEAIAVASKERLEASGIHSRPIVTSIEPAPTFWRAEEYHQRYLEKRGSGSCRLP